MGRSVPRNDVKNAVKNFAPNHHVKATAEVTASGHFEVYKQGTVNCESARARSSLIQMFSFVNGRYFIVYVRNDSENIVRNDLVSILLLLLWWLLLLLLSRITLLL
jgi:hypothetical protein